MVRIKINKANFHTTRDLKQSMFGWCVELVPCQVSEHTPLVTADAPCDVLLQSFSADTVKL